MSSTKGNSSGGSSSNNSSGGWSFFPPKKPVNDLGAEGNNNNEANWNQEDDNALQELKRALREYYNGENIQNRSRQLATLKMFGSWDADEDWEDKDVKAWRQFCQDMSCFDDEHTQRRKLMYETEAQDEVNTIKANPVVDQAVWPIAIIRNSMKMNPQAMDEALFDEMKEEMKEMDLIDDDDDSSSILSGRSGRFVDGENPTAMVPTSSASCSPTRKKKKDKSKKQQKKEKKKQTNHNHKKIPHVDVVFVSQDRYRQAHGVEVMATPRDRVRDVYAGQGLAKF